jgi:hypothetical protein
LQIDFEDVLKHGITAFLMIVEMLIGRVPIVSTFILPAVIYAICYAIFLWIYWAAADEWVYRVLDWRKPGHLAYYLAVVVLVVVCFWIMCASTHVLCAALRRNITSDMSVPVLHVPGTQSPSLLVGCERCFALAQRRCQHTHNMPTCTPEFAQCNGCKEHGVKLQCDCTVENLCKTAYRFGVARLREALVSRCGCHKRRAQPYATDQQLAML